MNKTDKETLLELHMSMLDLIKEVKTILKMEAPKPIYDRAEPDWINNIEASLGYGNYIDAYNGTFWITLEELGILRMDGTMAELKDDEDEEDEEEDRWENEGGPPVTVNGKPLINETFGGWRAKTGIPCDCHQRWHAECKDCNPPSKRTESKEEKAGEQGAQQ